MMLVNSAALLSMLLLATARNSQLCAEFIFKRGEQRNWHDLQYLSAGAIAGAIILGLMLFTALRLEPNSSSLFAACAQRPR